jgi:predicted small metal-binding protein
MGLHKESTRPRRHPATIPADDVTRRARGGATRNERRSPMKEFFCGAVVPDCTARFKADSEDAILAEVAIHAHEDHGMEHVPDAVIDAVRAQIREVR